jgi:hypothetical protein
LSISYNYRAARGRLKRQALHPLFSANLGEKCRNLQPAQAASLCHQKFAIWKNASGNGWEREISVFFFAFN